MKYTFKKERKKYCTKIKGLEEQEQQIENLDKFAYEKGQMREKAMVNINMTSEYLREQI